MADVKATDSEGKKMAAAAVRREETRSALTPTREDKPRSVLINLRASEEVRELIDTAAAAIGKSRTEFMLDSARRYAVDVLLERQIFQLSEEKYEAFVQMLDQAPKPREELRKLLASKSPWEP